MGLLPIDGLLSHQMVTPQDPDDEQRSADRAESNISHFIPSLELKGSRVDKLRQLDTLIGHLQRLRRSLAGDGRDPARGGFEGPSRLIGSPDWPWLSAGAVLGALCVVLFIAARSCA